MGETIYGVCSSFLCDIEPGSKVKINWPHVGKGNAAAAE